MTETLNYRLSQHVVTSSFEDDGGVLVDLEQRAYHRVNETAVIILNAVVEGITKAELVSRLMARYDVNALTAEASIARILLEMESLGLISRVP